MGTPIENAVRRLERVLQQLGLELGETDVGAGTLAFRWIPPRPPPPVPGERTVRVRLSQDPSGNVVANFSDLATPRISVAWVFPDSDDVMTRELHEDVFNRIIPSYLHQWKRRPELEEEPGRALYELEEELMHRRRPSDREPHVYEPRRPPVPDPRERFCPDGGLIGPRHPDFGEVGPGQQGPPPPTGYRPPHGRFDPYDPFLGRGEPDPNHQPPPGNFPGFPPRSFM